MIVQKRRRSPRAQNYRTGVWSGFGGVNAQGGWTPEAPPPVPAYESCSAVDSACVARNLKVNQGYQQALAIATYGHDGDGNGPLGYLDATKNPYVGPVAPVTSVAPAAAVVSAPMNQTVIQRRAVNPIESRNAGRVPSATVEPSVSESASVTPAGQVIVTSSGVQTALTTDTSTSSSFDFSAIPWYVWAGGAVAALYFMGGQGGR